MIIYGAFSSVVEWCRCYCYAGNLTVHAVAYFCYLCWCSQFHWRHRGNYGFQYLPMICTVMLCSTVRSTKHYRVYRGIVGDNAIPWLYSKPPTRKPMVSRGFTASNQCQTQKMCPLYHLRDLHLWFCRVFLSMVRLVRSPSR